MPHFILVSFKVLSTLLFPSCHLLSLTSPIHRTVTQQSQPYCWSSINSYCLDQLGITKNERFPFILFHKLLLKDSFPILNVPLYLPNIWSAFLSPGRPYCDIYSKTDRLRMNCKSIHLSETIFVYPFKYFLLYVEFYVDWEYYPINNQVLNISHHSYLADMVSDEDPWAFRECNSYSIPPVGKVAFFSGFFCDFSSLCLWCYAAHSCFMHLVCLIVF